MAAELGVELRIEWIDVHRETATGMLLDGKCDFALGVPIDPRAYDDDDKLAEKVIYSRPYYGTGYLLVGRKDGRQVRTLSELKGADSRRLGTEAGSIADYRLRQRGYLRRLFKNQLAVLNSINNGTIDHGYLWANVGWALRTTPEFELELMRDYLPEDHWNIAIAMRPGDDQLRRQVDAALEKVIGRGDVRRLLAEYHTPYFPPFGDDEPASDAAEGDAEVDDDRVEEDVEPTSTDRAEAPRMYRRQLSKKGYSGLDRIRSAGTITVGLDQNNLPFSTAHPEPAGMDYEIAQQLAEQLGVSLDVYWAYSSHGSYPSKLATKGLCDVMLGVMPDDRFGQRVLYSKPYYQASYQLVVVADSEGPQRLDQMAGEPLGIEAGIAVRGVGGNLKQYASLQDVLQAVVSGEVPAGYVISTRGPWLAEKLWPGKLKFIDVAGPVDKFPICAAVRRADRDLKTAIDSALGELARSGQLAEVFRRWNIGYDTNFADCDEATFDAVTYEGEGPAE